MPERTFVLLKPDAVGRGLNFQITERFEKRGFKLVACRMQHATPELAEAHYASLKGGAAFKEKVEFLTSGPSIATAWEAPGAVVAAQATAGDANPAKAARGSIRGDLAIDPERNLLECSADGPAAQRDLALWFTTEELGNTTTPPAKPVKAAAAPTASAAPPAENVGQTKAQKKEAKKAEKKGRGKAAAEPTDPLLADPTFYEPPSGTRDFFPEHMRVRKWLFSHFREVARQFAFLEYDAPVLERTRLWQLKARKAAEAQGIDPEQMEQEEIFGQMYNFVDKDEKEVTLRPEMTPTLARMILSLGDRFLKPVKWYSLPQCWRFETVQRGRKREHFQWNMDIIGEPSIAAEVELLAAVTTFFKSVGVTSEDVGIKVNSRKVLSTILSKYGVSQGDFNSVCVIVDKLDKIGADATVELLINNGVNGMPEAAARSIVESLSLKTIDDLRALTGEHGKEAVDDLENLFQIAGEYGFGDWLYFDASVVRGLGYYTGVVFEGFDRKGELRAICGGGRYDKLLSTYGSKEVVPACGFGFGDCVIM
jgi:histidyl-tRNA synthetase